MVLSASGTILEQQRYFPFGAPRPVTPYAVISSTDLTYTGQRSLSGTGLMDYKARFYSPYISHFIQPDTIIPAPSNPQSSNKYSYVSNNPIRFNDPTGHKACDEQDENGKCYTSAEYYNLTMKRKDPSRAKNPDDLKTSDDAKEQIITWEGGFWDTPYLDGVDHKTGNCTIGYGTLLAEGACPGSVKKYYRENPLAESVGRAWFERDILKAENTIKNSVKVPLTQSQFNALVSYVYNTGGQSNQPFFVKGIPELLNNGKYYEAASAIESGPITGVNIGHAPGLVNRRREEAAMFLFGP